MPICSVCGEQKPVDGFSNNQLRKLASSRACRICSGAPPEPNAKPCASCGEDLPSSAFSRRQWKMDNPLRRCSECVSRGLLPQSTHRDSASVASEPRSGAAGAAGEGDVPPSQGDRPAGSTPVVDPESLVSAAVAVASVTVPEDSARCCAVCGESRSPAWFSPTTEQPCLVCWCSTDIPDYDPGETGGDRATDTSVVMELLKLAGRPSSELIAEQLGRSLTQPNPKADAVTEDFFVSQLHVLAEITWERISGGRKRDSVPALARNAAWQGVVYLRKRKEFGDGARAECMRSLLTLLKTVFCWIATHSCLPGTRNQWTSAEASQVLQLVFAVLTGILIEESDPARESEYMEELLSVWTCAIPAFQNLTSRVQIQKHKQEPPPKRIMVIPDALTLMSTPPEFPFSGLMTEEMALFPDCIAKQLLLLVRRFVIAPVLIPSSLPPDLTQSFMTRLQDLFSHLPFDMMMVLVHFTSVAVNEALVLGGHRGIWAALELQTAVLRTPDVITLSDALLSERLIMGGTLNLLPIPAFFTEPIDGHENDSWSMRLSNSPVWVRTAALRCAYWRAARGSYIDGCFDGFPGWRPGCDVQMDGWAWDNIACFLHVWRIGLVCGPPDEALSLHQIACELLNEGPLPKDLLFRLCLAKGGPPLPDAHRLVLHLLEAAHLQGVLQHPSSRPLVECVVERSLARRVNFGGAVFVISLDEFDEKCAENHVDYYLRWFTGFIDADNEDEDHVPIMAPLHPEMWEWIMARGIEALTQLSNNLGEASTGALSEGPPDEVGQMRQAVMQAVVGASGQGGLVDLVREGQWNNPKLYDWSAAEETAFSRLLTDTELPIAMSLSWIWRERSGIADHVEFFGFALLVQRQLLHVLQRHLSPTHEGRVGDATLVRLVQHAVTYLDVCLHMRDEDNPEVFAVPELVSLIVSSFPLIVQQDQLRFVRRVAEVAIDTQSYAGDELLGKTKKISRLADPSLPEGRPCLDLVCHALWDLCRQDNDSERSVLDLLVSEIPEAAAHISQTLTILSRDPSLQSVSRLTQGLVSSDVVLHPPVILSTLLFCRRQTIADARIVKLFDSLYAPLLARSTTALMAFILDPSSFRSSSQAGAQPTLEAPRAEEIIIPHGRMSFGNRMVQWWLDTVTCLGQGLVGTFSAARYPSDGPEWSTFCTDAFFTILGTVEDALRLPKRARKSAPKLPIHATLGQVIGYWGGTECLWVNIPTRGPSRGRLPMSRTRFRHLIVTAVYISLRFSSVSDDDAEEWVESHPKIDRIMEKKLYPWDMTNLCWEGDEQYYFDDDDDSDRW